MNIRCAFGWHRWKRALQWVWSPRAVQYTTWGTDRIQELWVVGHWQITDRICADCRKRDINR